MRSEIENSVLIKEESNSLDRNLKCSRPSSKEAGGPGWGTDQCAFWFYVVQVLLGFAPASSCANNMKDKEILQEKYIES